MNEIVLMMTIISASKCLTDAHRTSVCKQMMVILQYGVVSVIVSPILSLSFAFIHLTCVKFHIYIYIYIYIIVISISVCPLANKNLPRLWLVLVIVFVEFDNGIDPDRRSSSTKSDSIIRFSNLKWLIIKNSKWEEKQNKKKKRKKTERPHSHSNSIRSDTAIINEYIWRDSSFSHSLFYFFSSLY